MQPNQAANHRLPPPALEAAPCVSVVVPNYNHARFLEQRLRSVLEQTFQDFEVILLDDASTDNSREVFAPFSIHPKIRTVLNAINSGSPFAQWNKGARLARGRYLWIAEADDFAEPRFLEVLVTVLDRQPAVGLAYCRSEYVDAAGRPLGVAEDYRQRLHPTRWTADFVNNGREECRDYLLYANTIPNASAVLFRKSAFEQAGCADETFRLGGDWMTYGRILLRADIAYVAQTLNHFRRHQASVSTHATRNSTSLEETYRIMTSLMAQLDLGPVERAKLAEYARSSWLDALRSGALPVTVAAQWRIARAARRIDRRLPGQVWRTYAPQYRHTHSPWQALRRAAARWKHRLVSRNA